MISFFEGVDERRIGVPFPDEETQAGFRFMARGERKPAYQESEQRKRSPLSDVEVVLSWLHEIIRLWRSPRQQTDLFPLHLERFAAKNQNVGGVFTHKIQASERPGFLQRCGVELSK